MSTKRRLIITVVCLSLLLGGVVIPSYASAAPQPIIHYDIKFETNVTWKQIGSKWAAYSSGKRLCDTWVSWKNGWYRINSKGWMQAGFQSETIAGHKVPYYFDKSGKLADGWKKIGGAWYHYNFLKIITSSWFNDNGKWYRLNADGRMLTGWPQSGGAWYYLRQNGAMAENDWIGDRGSRYYLKPGGKMAHAETLAIDGETYSFDGSGKLIQAA